ncbi:unnamed protein product [Symbiodinium natans]|uniref:Uncharacterized protein n=1 Tax=Symbiodinium natans TaxID=878477 RepID=A0A812TUD2_9DINO|nr:unnamed protein product [Symbiodinium natans]
MRIWRFRPTFGHDMQHEFVAKKKAEFAAQLAERDQKILELEEQLAEARQREAELQRRLAEAHSASPGAPTPAMPTPEAPMASLPLPEEEEVEQPRV